jgi:hypothetical protein
MATQFWMVYSRNGQHPPKYEHSSIEAARAESERLARLIPGQRFYVLEAVATVVVENPCKWDDLTLPF